MGVVFDYLVVGFEVGYGYFYDGVGFVGGFGGGDDGGVGD